MKQRLRTRSTLIAVLLAAGLAGFHGNALALGGLADIQIVDRAENRRLPVYWHEGKAYVVGKPGNEYQISVRNRAGADILAVVSVDGVNAVSGETAAPEQTGYVLGNRINYDIKGWRKSLDRTAAFYFTQLPDSYAARTGRPDNVGVIGVAVFRRKQVEPPVAISRLEQHEDREYRAIPYRDSSRESARDSAGSAAAARRFDQPPASAPNSASTLRDQSAELARMAPAPEKSLGTGHGRSEASVVRNVAFERATPNPEEVITIYYDSQRNLMARGVIPPIPQARPQPFPGRFVQDPPRG